MFDLKKENSDLEDHDPSDMPCCRHWGIGKPLKAHIQELVNIRRRNRISCRSEVRSTTTRQPTTDLPLSYHVDARLYMCTCMRSD